MRCDDSTSSGCRKVSGTLLTLVDVPLVTSSTVRAVVKRYRHTGASIVRPTRGDEHGHPVLIDRALFPVLRAADPSEGAKPVVRRRAPKVLMMGLCLSATRDGM